MKKKFSITLFAALIVAMLLPGMAGAATSDDIEARIPQMALPVQYSITYAVNDGDGIISNVTRAQDADGNIYYQSGGKSTLFLLEDGAYTAYEKKADGLYINNTDGISYTQQYVDEYTNDFLEYANTSNKRHLPTVKPSGETEILGRPAANYDIAIKIINFSQNYSFDIDMETGICLRWEETTMVSGHDLGSDNPTFTCVEFLTEDVTLPAIKNIFPQDV